MEKADRPDFSPKYDETKLKLGQNAKRVLSMLEKDSRKFTGEHSAANNKATHDKSNSKKPERSRQPTNATNTSRTEASPKPEKTGKNKAAKRENLSEKADKIWLDPILGKLPMEGEEPDNRLHIGIDESGNGATVGDWYVAAVGVPEKQMVEFQNHPLIKDSKKMSDKNLMDGFFYIIDLQIYKKWPVAYFRVKVEEEEHANVQDLIQEKTLMCLAKIKSTLEHWRVTRISIDAVGSISNYQHAIRQASSQDFPEAKILVSTKGESKNSAIAAASIVATYKRKEILSKAALDLKTQLLPYVGTKKQNVLVVPTDAREKVHIAKVKEVNFNFGPGVSGNKVFDKWLEDMTPVAQLLPALVKQKHKQVVSAYNDLTTRIKGKAYHSYDRPKDVKAFAQDYGCIILYANSPLDYIQPLYKSLPVNLTDMKKPVYLSFYEKQELTKEELINQYRELKVAKEKWVEAAMAARISSASTSLLPIMQIINEPEPTPDQNINLLNWKQKRFQQILDLGVQVNEIRQKLPFRGGRPAESRGQEQPQQATSTTPSNKSKSNATENQKDQDKLKVKLEAAIKPQDSNQIQQPNLKIAVGSRTQSPTNLEIKLPQEDIEKPHARKTATSNREEETESNEKPKKKKKDQAGLLTEVEHDIDPREHEVLTLHNLTESIDRQTEKHEDKKVLKTEASEAMEVAKEIFRDSNIKEFIEEIEQPLREDLYGNEDIEHNSEDFKVEEQAKRKAPKRKNRRTKSKVSLNPAPKKPAKSKLKPQEPELRRITTKEEPKTITEKRSSPSYSENQDSEEFEMQQEEPVSVKRGSAEPKQESQKEPQETKPQISKRRPEPIDKQATAEAKPKSSKRTDNVKVKFDPYKQIQTNTDKRNAEKDSKKTPSLREFKRATHTKTEVSATEDEKQLNPVKEQDKKADIRNFMVPKKPFITAADYKNMVLPIPVRLSDKNSIVQPETLTSEVEAQKPAELTKSQEKDKKTPATGTQTQPVAASSSKTGQVQFVPPFATNTGTKVGTSSSSQVPTATGKSAFSTHKPQQTQKPESTADAEVK